MNRPSTTTTAQQRRTDEGCATVTLIKIYRLLWITVVLLAGIILPAIREYMFILAGLLLFDLFYRIWATRKIGLE